MVIKKYGRFWAVYDADGTLVCVCVYKRGAAEVIRRLTRQGQESAMPRSLETSVRETLTRKSEIAR